MATITAVAARSMQPTYRVNSTATKVQTYVTSASLSVGDIIVFNDLKLPHRAVVTDIRMKSSNPDGQIVLAAGTIGSGSTINLFGSRTASVAIGTGYSTFSIQGAFTISVSDDAVDRYQWFCVRVDGQTSATASASLQFVVTYTTS